MRTRREDWITCGVELLREGRFDALKVDELARRLERTKGSFYHHFIGIPAFRKALLDNWQESHTRKPIREASRYRGEKRRAVLHRVIDKLDVRLERAIRAWATIDPQVRKACARVDTQRMRYLAVLWRYTGLTMAQAQRHGELEYTAFLGRLILHSTKITKDSGAYALVSAVTKRQT